MVQIKCTAPDTVKLSELVPFQGELKKRSDQDISDLANSIKTEGLLMPFAVWKHDGKNYLLDGHGRLEAFIRMSGEYPNIFTDVDFPCINVEAETEEDARKALLQITSSYGKITKKGAAKFMVSIPNYKAPAINKLVYKPIRPKKIDKTTSIIRIKVPVEKEEDVRKLLSTVDFITVM